jgi:6-phosphogluconolactonase (cycloisomerase 2 family)
MLTNHAPKTRGEYNVHLRTRIASTIGLLALALAGSVTAAHGVSAQSNVVGHVYVNDNTAGTNTIAAFERHADGTLAPLAGSPFSAGGAGTGSIVGSQGALQVTDDGRYLLAVDAGSSQISVLRIGADGALQAVGSPVSSNGIEPISIAVHRNLVYVANEGNGSSGSNYTGFTLSSTGQLSPLSSSTVSLSNTALPGDVLFNSTGTHLIGTEVGPASGPSFIDSFTVGSDGRLTAAPGSPFPAQATGPFGSEFRPTNPSQLYVSNAHAGANAGSVSAYDVTANGVLDPIDGSPFFDKQTAACWVEITHDGKYLFTVNTGSSSISRYKILSDGALSLLGSTVFNDPTGLRPFDARLDPHGHNLYVVDPGLNKVSAFAVDGGNLTELSSSPFDLPTGATPFGIVVTQTGQEAR